MCVPSTSGYLAQLLIHWNKGITKSQIWNEGITKSLIEGFIEGFIQILLEAAQQQYYHILMLQTQQTMKFSADLNKCSSITGEYRLHKLQAKCSGHLSHAREPEWLIRIYQLAQVLYVSSIYKITAFIVIMIY